MQSICTKFIPASNVRGARISARAQAGHRIYSWDDALGIDENHTAAARKFALKLGWSGTWIGGGLPNGKGNVFVNVDKNFSCGAFKILK